MKITKNFGLNMPDEDDFVEIDKINENAEKIDEELAKKADASGGDISETVITTVKASQAEYPVPAAGDSAKTVLGKVQKFFADIRNWMKGVCLLGQIVNNCVTDNAKLPLSAAQGKVLMDLYNVLNTNLQKKADSSQIPTSMAWSKITGKPSTYAPSSHTHDDRYYTESEINTKISKRLRFTWADDATGLVISIDGQKFRIPQANMSKYTSNYDS